MIDLMPLCVAAMLCWSVGFIVVLVVLTRNKDKN